MTLQVYGAQVGGGRFTANLHVTILTMCDEFYKLCTRILTRVLSRFDTRITNFNALSPPKINSRKLSLILTLCAPMTSYTAGKFQFVFERAEK